MEIIQAATGLPRPSIARFCERCGTVRHARWPKSDPHFCSMRCAAENAVGNTNMLWCDNHGDWYHQDDGCYDCQKEE